MSKKLSYKYDVALSFAGEDRVYVKQVADCLKKNGIKTFYDEDEEAGLWGKDLYTYLDDIYFSKSKYCVMFLSKHYAKKHWTKHERQSAQARAFENNQEYILPYRFDQTEIPGIRSTILYLENKRPEELCRIIIAKVRNVKLENRPKDDFETQLKSYKEYLNKSYSTQWIEQLEKDLNFSPEDPLMNLIYCLALLNQKDLLSTAINSQTIKKIESYLNFPLENERFSSTALIIQLLIKYDFYESKGWKTSPTAKEVFYKLKEQKSKPDKDLIRHLRFSKKLTSILKQFAIWPKN